MSDKTTKSDSQVTEKITGTKIAASTISTKQSTNSNSGNNKDSIECLHESKPAPNISINATIYEKNDEEDSNINTTSSTVKSKTSNSNNTGNTAKIETVYEKLSAVSEQSEPSYSLLKTDEKKVEDNKVDDKKKGPNSVTEINNEQQKEKKNAENDHNDMWRLSDSYGKLNKQRDLSSSVFPAGCMGCKDNTQEQSSPRRFLDAKEAAEDFTGHIDSTPRKRPSSARPQNNRNPLTGDGCEDSVKKFNNRKKGKIKIFNTNKKKNKTLTLRKHY